MHYYQFNIADYRKDTGHLSHEEHGIYRALLDQCYLDEQPLTLDIRALMRKLRLTSDQKETLELILGDFFKKTANGYENNRVGAELQRLYDKSESARRSAKARWDANASDKDANAVRTHSEGNANGMLPINPTPINPITQVPNNPKLKRAEQKEADKGKGRKRPAQSKFKPPTVSEAQSYLDGRKITSFSGEYFCDYYIARGWQLSHGKQMKDWKAAVRTWEARSWNKDELESADPLTGCL